MSKEKRIQITHQQITNGIGRLEGVLLQQLSKKGYGTFASIHEILGLIEEERHELIEAIQSNNHHNIREELLDIAVVALFGEICIVADTVDW